MNQFIRKYRKLGICLVVFFGIFLFHNTAHAQGIASSWFGLPSPLELVGGISKVFGQILLMIGSGVLLVIGLLFDFVLNITIVDMSQSIGNPNGVGGGISSAWATLRDVANMVFIFVLVWAAIQTILDLNTGKFKEQIRNIIIIALLINFSLFFSKVVIDAGNILTIGFYNSIMAGSSTSSFSGIFSGLTQIQSFHAESAAEIMEDGLKALELGLFGMITQIILAMVLLVACVMFIARYIILIFVLVLSPLAFIAYVIPGMSGKFKEWWNALVNQTFFAPYFMLLIWVALKIIVAIQASIDSLQDSTNNLAALASGTPSKIMPAMGLVVNFVLVIGFIIGAVILAKKMATSTAAGAAFTATTSGILTGAGFVGRQTVGRGARAVVNSERLRNQASEGKTWASRAFAKSTLWTANKGQGASFDLRSMPGGGKALGGMGKVGGKGGFKQAVEDKAKAKAKYGKDVYGQIAEEKERAEELKQKYEGYTDKDGVYHKGGKGEYEDKKREYDQARSAEEQKIRDGRNKEVNKAKEGENSAQKEFEAKKAAHEYAKVTGIGSAGETTARKEMEDAERKLANVKLKHIQALEQQKAKIEDDQYSDQVKALKDDVENYKTEAEEQRKDWEETRDRGKERMGAYANRLTQGPPRATSAVIGGILGSVGGPMGSAAGAYLGYKAGGKIKQWIGNSQGNKAAAAEVRKASKEKSTKDKAADILKDLAKDDPTLAGEPAAPAVPDENTTNTPA